MIEGTLSVTVGDDDRNLLAGPGTFVLVPAGTPHAIVNSGSVDRALPERPRTRWLRPADRARELTLTVVTGTSSRIHPASRAELADVRGWRP